MINNEFANLVKQLKDLGFKQGGSGYLIPQKFVANKSYEVGDIIEPLEIGYLYVPTLAELIEACGERFECLYRIVNTDLSIKYWQVHGFGIDKLENADTPEEAVAKLYVLLKQP